MVDFAQVIEQRSSSFRFTVYRNRGTHDPSRAPSFQVLMNAHHNTTLAAAVVSAGWPRAMLHYLKRLRSEHAHVVTRGLETLIKLITAWLKAPTHGCQLANGDGSFGKAMRRLRADSVSCLRTWLLVKDARIRNLALILLWVVQAIDDDVLKGPIGDAVRAGHRGAQLILAQTLRGGATHRIDVRVTVMQMRVLDQPADAALMLLDLSSLNLGSAPIVSCLFCVFCFALLSVFFVLQIILSCVCVCCCFVSVLLPSDAARSITHSYTRDLFLLDFHSPFRMMLIMT
jgi:hypothetical protein